MAVVNVPNTDSFDQQRVKINTIATNQGDVATLATPVATDVVQAVNSLNVKVDSNQKTILVRAIALT